MTHTPHPAERQEQHMDDLTQIHGIGQAMEHKLNQAGVFTFDQLANMPTEKLAAIFSHVPGWSAEREKDLILQARDLMEKKAATSNLESDDNTQTQYPAQFSVDLLLDNQKRVRRTHIIHVQSGKEELWGEWDKDRLADFILTAAIITPDPMRTESVEHQPGLNNLRQDEDQAGMKKTMGEVNILEAKIQAISGRPMHWLVTADQPLEVRLTLDMSRSSFSPGTLLQYQTEVHVKNLTDGKRQIVGVTKSTLKSRNLVPLVVNCDALPAGSYRLEACVVLAPDLEDPDLKSRLVALSEGMVFRVS